METDIILEESYVASYDEADHQEEKLRRERRLAALKAKKLELRNEFLTVISETEVFYR